MTHAVKMHSIAAGPDGVRHPGEIHQVSEADGRALVQARAAVWHGAAPRETATIGPKENAATSTKAPPPKKKD